MVNRCIGDVKKIAQKRPSRILNISKDTQSGQWEYEMENTVYTWLPIMTINKPVSIKHKVIREQLEFREIIIRARFEYISWILLKAKNMLLLKLLFY